MGSFSFTVAPRKPPAPPQQPWGPHRGGSLFGGLIHVHRPLRLRPPGQGRLRVPSIQLRPQSTCGEHSYKYGGPLCCPGRGREKLEWEGLVPVPVMFG